MKNNIIVGKNLLETLTSALYENPIILFREYVQNSLDAYNYAKKHLDLPILEDFKVDINIDHQNSSITITDNGYAILTEDEFEKAMLSFGDSMKTDRSQFIGFRGIGRISALPFCKKLVFKSKASGSSIVNICEWDGSKYRDLLNFEDSVERTFDDLVRSVVKIYSEKADNTDEHYFAVHIEEYGIEVKEVVQQLNFTEQLKKILPITYSQKFSAAEKIIEKYNSFMNEDLKDFMCPVTINGVALEKNYTDANILESDIIFWEIRGKSVNKNKAGDKIGILWFTFNKKMIAAKDNDYGILIRSKNVLMGNNDTFADLCSNSKEHISTYSELTATLRGVYGELLINSNDLKDNARREWFKTDEYSIYLKYIIIDFMKRLYAYRYKASQYYRLKTTEKVDKKKSELKKALIELIDIEKNKINIDSFCVNENINNANQEDEDKEDFKASYSEEDIPRQSATKKKIYDELMEIIEQFFVREKKLEVFLKLRAHIKNKYNR